MCRFGTEAIYVLHDKFPEHPFTRSLSLDLRSIRPIRERTPPSPVTQSTTLSTVGSTSSTDAYPDAGPDVETPSQSQRQPQQRHTPQRPAQVLFGSPPSPPPVETALISLILSRLRTRPVLLFPKLNKTCYGYIDPQIVVLGYENKQFLGRPNRCFG